MLKISLAATFVLSLATLGFAASVIPAPTTTAAAPLTASLDARL